MPCTGAALEMLFWDHVSYIADGRRQLQYAPTPYIASITPFIITEIDVETQCSASGLGTPGTSRTTDETPTKQDVRYEQIELDDFDYADFFWSEQSSSAGNAEQIVMRSIHSIAFVVQTTLRGFSHNSDIVFMRRKRCHQGDGRRFSQCAFRRRGPTVEGFHRGRFWWRQCLAYDRLRGAEVNREEDGSGALTDKRLTIEKLHGRINWREALSLLSEITSGSKIYE